MRPGAILEGVTRPEDLRAGDADRERVAERLRKALEEGRLTFVEYDERVRQAYASATYGELEALLTDLPGTAIAVPSLDIEPARPGLTRRWIWNQWERWVYANIVCAGIWVAGALAGGGAQGYWPVWVAGPWGAVLLARTIGGLAHHEPQAQERRRVEKAQKKALADRERAAKAVVAEPTSDPES